MGVPAHQTDEAAGRGDRDQAGNGAVVDYRLLLPNQKQEAVRRFKELNFHVIAAGDSYNDTTMLQEAHAGILFNAPQNVIEAFSLRSQISRGAAQARAAGCRISTKKKGAPAGAPATPSRKGRVDQ